MVNKPRPLPKCIIRTTGDEVTLAKIPKEFWQHKKVFSEQASHQLPKHTEWDHAIDLLPGAPATLSGRLLPLNQLELKEQDEFIEEHLK
jgi:hypothetical protein